VCSGVPSAMEELASLGSYGMVEIVGVSTIPQHGKSATSPYAAVAWQRAD
jgi:hypothetical protein